jgi:putative transposase
MKSAPSRYHGHRFPPKIIGYAVWVYHRFCLSFRDVEDLLAERGIIVSYEAIRQWCWKFGPDYARRLKKKQGRLGVQPSVPSQIVARSRQATIPDHR